jgi:hypothetical protein
LLLISAKLFRFIVLIKKDKKVLPQARFAPSSTTLNSGNFILYNSNFNQQGLTPFASLCLRGEKIIHAEQQNL